MPTAGWLISPLGIAAAVLLFAAVFVFAKALLSVPLIETIRQRRENIEEDPTRMSRSLLPMMSRGLAPRILLAPLLYGSITSDTIARGLGELNQLWMRPQWAEKMKKRFLMMGRPEIRPEDFRARQQIYAILFAVVGFVLASMLGRSWTVVTTAGLALGGFGLLFPYIWLRDQIIRRQRAIRSALPYHLDLLTLSLEAGLDFAQGLSTMVERGRPGPLVEELGITVSEMKLGKTREEALRNLSERVQLMELNTFTSSIIQADKMGTSLGKVLRIQSAQMRVMRAQQAEKAANEAPVKMLLPLVLCFFPTVFMILFGPIVYRLVIGG